MRKYVPGSLHLHADLPVAEVLAIRAEHRTWHQRHELVVRDPGAAVEEPGEQVDDAPVTCPFKVKSQRMNHHDMPPEVGKNATPCAFVLAHSRRAEPTNTRCLNL